MTSFLGALGDNQTLTGLQMSITRLSSDLELLIPLPLIVDEIHVWVAVKVVEVVSLKSSKRLISTGQDSDQTPCDRYTVVYKRYLLAFNVSLDSINRKSVNFGKTTCICWSGYWIWRLISYLIVWQKIKFNKNLL